MHRITIGIDDEIFSALDRVRTDMDPALSHEIVVMELLRDWLISARYLPYDDIEEDTPTGGEA